MADDQRTALRRQRLITFAAVETLAIATALAFSRVFVGGASWKLVLAAGASAALATLLERRGLPLATLVATAVLVLAIGWLIFPQTTWYGLPTADTLASLADALGQVGRQAREQVSPTVPLEPLLLAAVTAVWAAAFSIHALSARAGSPLLALVPSIALIGFADSALRGKGTIPFAFLFLIGALAMLFADGVRRMRQWGTVRPWRGPSGRTRTLVVRGAGSVAALTLTAALALPGLLPGFGSEAVIDLRASNDSTSLDPLVSIRAQLTRRDPQTLFRVSTDTPTYYRMLALDQFDGDTFRTADLRASRAPFFSSGEPLGPAQPSLGERVLRQRITVERDLSFPWIPAAYEPQTIELSDVPGFRFDVDNTTAVAVETLEQGETYEVESRFVVPTAEQLAAERVSRPSVDHPEMAQLPPDLPPDIDEIAEKWTQGETTAYAKILAIQRRLLEDFEYSTTVQPTADSDALVQFLTVSKKGFCQQFATAMAVLVRSLGYPARVAVGFTQGEPDVNGTYVVTTENTHSWVEVYFPTYGWLAFEPTPDRINPVAAPYLHPAQSECLAAPGGCGDGGQSGGQGARPPGFAQLGPDPLSPPRGPITGRGRSQARGGGAVTPDGGPNLWPWMLGALGAAFVFALLVPPAKAIRRRARIARARDPRALALASYDVFAARAGDLGLGRRPGETMEEYRRRLRAAARFSDGHLDRLTAVASRAAYAPEAPRSEEARGAERAARTAIRALRRERGRLRQLRGIYRAGL